LFYVRDAYVKLSLAAGSRIIDGEHKRPNSQGANTTPSQERNGGQQSKANGTARRREVNGNLAEK
jgi:hypothetical protein